MAKIRRPITFSEHFHFDRRKLERLGILNPVLNVDTKLFIDPVLLDASRHAAISNDAVARFQSYFEDIIRLLRAARKPGDIPWRAAESRLRFHEIVSTCLGYGAANIRGSGFGRELTGRLIGTAKEIVDLGVTDPDLFKLLPLLEEGIGPDLISDLTTNVILDDLASFTTKTCRTLGVRTEVHVLKARRFMLPTNPTQAKPTPVLLVPTDVLRSLPLATDWSEVADAAAESAAARERVNQLIGDIWSRKIRRDKAKLRRAVLESREAFESVLELLRKAKKEPYDMRDDPEGLAVWRAVHETVAQDFPLSLSVTGPPGRAAAIRIVDAIVGHFKELVETKGLWRLLWHEGAPHKEKVAQMCFFAVADAYCKANNLDVTPEADTGSGTVDFKFSAGYAVRILVEAKLSTNPKLVPGYDRQLEAYRESEKPVYAIYLVIDVGGMGGKERKLIDLRNRRSGEGREVSEIILVDGKPRESASRR